jgi:plastocyanin
MRPRPLLWTAAMAAALLVTGCGATDPSTAPAPDEGPPALIDIVAADIAFEPTSITIPAGVDVRVHITNRDAAVPHNVALQAGPGFATKLIASEIMTGPAVNDLDIPGLVAGRYRFVCEVHPMMTVEVQVGPT